jgi:hypothetical protein
MYLRLFGCFFPGWNGGCSYEHSQQLHQCKDRDGNVDPKQRGVFIAS